MRHTAQSAARKLIDDGLYESIEDGGSVGRFRARSRDNEHLELNFRSTPLITRLIADGGIGAGAVLMFFVLPPAQGTISPLVAIIIAAPLLAVLGVVNWSDTWSIRLVGTSVDICHRRSAILPIWRKRTRLEAPVSSVILSGGVMLNDDERYLQITDFDQGQLGVLQARRLARWLRERGALSD
jgi:hypothetical protein